MNTVCVVRAAIADDGGRGEGGVLPRGEDHGAALYGGDVLAEAALWACAALLAGMADEARERTGLVIGTTLGCLEADRAFDRSRREAEGRYASPAAFSRTLPSTVAAEVSVKLRLRGPSLVVSGAHATALALRRAARWMEHFDLAYCIAGGVDWRGGAGGGDGTGREEGWAAALLLLSRDAVEKAAGWMTLSGYRDLASPFAGTGVDYPPGCAGLAVEPDEGIRRLGEWIRHPKELALGDGVCLTPPSPPPDQDQPGGGR